MKGILNDNRDSSALMNVAAIFCLGRAIFASGFLGAPGYGLARASPSHVTSRKTVSGSLHIDTGRLSLFRA